LALWLLLAGSASTDGAAPDAAQFTRQSVFCRLHGADMLAAPMPTTPPVSWSRERRFELAAQALVLYSIVVFYMESEMTAPDAPRAAAGFWLWNERALLALFGGEYLWRWAKAKDRWRYPFTVLAIIDLLAIGPSLVGLTLNFRSLKLLRILPLLWVFKLYRYNRALQNVLAGFRRVKSELAVVGFVALVVHLFSAVAMHELERQAQPEKFGTLSDSLWWSVVTMTTVGYGDAYPVTGAGRAVAVATMLVGIGVLGTFISLIGSSFLATMRTSDEPRETHARALPIAADVEAPAPWIGRKAG
jgi:voltage-gated potassium channel